MEPDVAFLLAPRSEVYLNLIWPNFVGLCLRISIKLAGLLFHQLPDARFLSGISLTSARLLAPALRFHQDARHNLDLASYTARIFSLLCQSF
jgi:hypothetical protein